jgi:hypothetical protein
MKTKKKINLVVMTCGGRSQQLEQQFSHIAMWQWVEDKMQYPHNYNHGYLFIDYGSYAVYISLREFNW